ncbi:MAG: hypothetical protein R2737_13610 [Candidatus Nanopelagicales bacterium]
MDPDPQAVDAPAGAAWVRGLTSPQGRAARATAARLADEEAAGAATGRPADPLRLATRLRSAHPDLPGDLLAAAATQARLARRARGRLAPRHPDGAPVDADALLYTDGGLQQASRTAVADHRAGRFAAAGASAVADLGCGLGADAWSLAGYGIRVVAVEADPATAAVATANAAAVAPDLVEVRLGDVTDPAVLEPVLAATDAAYVDPARRDPDGPRDAAGRRTRRLADPGSWSPPWPWVLGLAERQPRTVAKVAPGIARELAPEGCETAWTSVDGDLVEAAVWFPGLAEPGVRRRAVVLRTGRSPAQLTAGDAGPDAGDDAAPDVGPVGEWLLEPDDAVIRSGLVAPLAQRVDGRLLHPDVAWVTTDTRPDDALGRAWRVLAELPGAVAPLRAALRGRGFGDVVVKTRAVMVRPERLRRDLRLRGDGPTATLVVTRTAHGGVTLLVSPGDSEP